MNLSDIVVSDGDDWDSLLGESPQEIDTRTEEEVLAERLERARRRAAKEEERNRERLAEHPNLVLQRIGTDCGICCVAMITELPYEVVLERIETVEDLYIPERGGLQDPCVALSLFGFEWNGDDGDIINVHHGFLTPEFFRDRAWGRRALMFVPSGSMGGRGFCNHFVYYDGRNVLDPSRYKGYYTSFEELHPESMTLIREGAVARLEDWQ